MTSSRFLIRRVCFVDAPELQGAEGICARADRRLYSAIRGAGLKWSIAVAALTGCLFFSCPGPTWLGLLAFGVTLLMAALVAGASLALVSVVRWFMVAVRQRASEAARFDDSVGRVVNTLVALLVIRQLPSPPPTAAGFTRLHLPYCLTPRLLPIPSFASCHR